MDDLEIREKARRARNQYQREWRAKNKDKVREINQRYWQKKVMEEINGRRENGTTLQSGR